jgi:hypothetical protein
MTESFFLSIKNNKANEEAHRLFLRFGSGVFQREKMTIKKAPLVDVSSGYDYLGLFQDIFLETFSNDDIEYSGIVIGLNAKETIKTIEAHDIKIVKSIGKKHNIKGIAKGTELLKFKKALFEEKSGFLVSLTNGKNFIKSKTAYPKPGKTVENFVKMKIEDKAFKEMVNALGIKEFKKRAVIETTYDIEKVVFNEELLKKDPVQARLESKRQSKIIRSMTIDGVELKEEIKALI